VAPHDPLSLPADLPVPVDDGAADHLVGMAVPSLALPSTAGAVVDLATTVGLSIVFAYPRTGKPGEPSLGGDEVWDAIPGARGCTPQACAIRDEHELFVERGATVFGLSTQSPADQAEAAERLHLPYPLVSDERLELARALRLPTFEVEGVVLLKRLTLFMRSGVVEHVQYPVFPPNEAADAALAWLRGGAA
jgi:peroxiredoxin (alkyl hydroperoxide reductase subunit C)